MGHPPYTPNYPYFDRKMGTFGEIDSADTRAGKFPLASMGAERSVPRARTWEQGPLSVLAEFFFPVIVIINFVFSGVITSQRTIRRNTLTILCFRI